MRKISLVLTIILLTGLLAGCGSQKTSLVTKTPFPEFAEVDTNGNAISSDIFSQYDATIVNFWNNGCGTCIAEMPELEEMFQALKEKNINLIGVGADSGESQEQLETARKILSEKGVTYINISPDPENDFYKDFISQITGYPTTYIVDSEGNIIGAPIIGNVKKQEETVQKRLESITGAKVDGISAVESETPTVNTEAAENSEFTDNFSVDSASAESYAKKIQSVVANRDMEALADMAAYPMYIGFADGGVSVNDAQALMALGTEQIFATELMEAIAGAQTTDFAPSKAGFSLSKDGKPNIIFGVHEGTLAVLGINY